MSALCTVNSSLDSNIIGGTGDNLPLYLLFEKYSWQHWIQIPELPISSENEDPDLVISYQLVVKVVPDAMGFKSDGVILPVTIGNIPHKIAFSTFESSGEDLEKLPHTWSQKYSNAPAHGGQKFICYKVK